MCTRSSTPQDPRIRALLAFAPLCWVRGPTRKQKTVLFTDYTERLSRFQPNVDRPARHSPPALPCHCSCPATLLPEEAVFDFRIDLVEPLLCALRSIPVPLDFSL